MLERSFGIFFFLKKRSVSGKDECAIHLRVTVDGVRKEVFTKGNGSLHVGTTKRREQLDSAKTLELSITLLTIYC